MNNQLISLLEERKATRAIAETALEESVILELAEAIRLTPSCYNKQPWRFLFLQSEEGLKKGRETLTGGNRDWASRAPLLVVGYSRPEDDCSMSDGRKYHQFSMGMASMNLMLAATQLGLVARPMAGFDPVLLMDKFEIEYKYIPIIMVAVGYPDDDESHVPESYRGTENIPRSRYPVEKIIQFL